MSVLMDAYSWQWVVYWTFILGSYFFMYGVLVLAGVGLLWAPLAAIIAYRVARDRSLHPCRYALVGALYSTLLLIPWLYLVRVSLRGGSPPRTTICLGYVLLFVVWLLGPMAHVGLLLWLATYDGWDMSEAFLIGWPLALMMLAWVISLWRLTRLEQVYSPSAYETPSAKYVMPIALALASALVIFR